MKHLFILYLFVYFNTFATEISSPLLYRTQDFDVLHYDATIDFGITPRKLIHAKNEITIHWLKKTNESKFYFHLRSLSVDKVEYNGKQVDFAYIADSSYSDFHYGITPPVNDNKDTATIRIYYHGIMQNEGGMNPWGGVHDADVVFALGVGFHCNYVSTTRHWLACYDHPSDKATFKFTFINPINQFIASNGFGVKTSVDGVDAFVYSSDKPIATYLMTFADFNYTEHTIDYKIPIKIYAAEKYSNSIKKVFGKLPTIVDAFENMFGEYPFELIGYVLTPIGSMESQMMINLEAKVFENATKNNDTLNLTIAHELSHQWFGNSVTPYDFRDVYLNESWATYCESLLLEKLGNYSLYLREQEKKLNSYIKQIAPYEGYLPLYDFSRKPPSSNYPTTIYYKGAVVMGMLRYLITNGSNDDTFFDFIKDYLISFKYKNVSSYDFLNMVLKYNNDTLAVNRFFDSWVNKIGYPQFDIHLISNSNGTETKYQDLAIGQNNPKSWGVFSQIPIPISLLIGNKQVDTVIWIENGTADFVKLSELIGKDKLLFDTVYFNSGNTLRSLFTINSIQIINPNIVTETLNNFNFVLSNRILTIKQPYLGEEATIYIYDVLGRLIGNHKFMFNNVINFDLNYLSSGFYNFVILKNGNLVYKNKFMLN